MISHKIRLPGMILIEDSIKDSAGLVCKDLGLQRKCLLLSGQKTYDILGKDVLEDIRANNFRVKSKIVSSIEKDEIDKIIKFAQGFDYIVGVGSGKVIDIAKYVSFQNKIPYVSVPTSASHDGITSPRATLTKKGKRYSYEAQSPIAILVDINTIKESPYRMIASGCADVISNITAVPDWRLAHKERNEFYSEYAATLSISSAQIVLESADKIRDLKKTGIKNLMEALINSGIAMCIAGSSRPSSGSEHLFSHALDAIFPEKMSLHGEQCGVGTIISAYLYDLNWKRIQKVLKSLRCPVSAHELRIPEKIVLNALLQAKDIRKDRYTILNKKPLNETMAREILLETGIIE